MLNKLSSIIFPCNQRVKEAIEHHKCVKMEVIEEIKKATDNIVNMDKHNESH